MSTSSSGSQTASIRQFYDKALKFKKAGDLDEAETICRRALVIHARDPNLLCLLGETLLRQRKPQEALTWFSRTLKNFPGYPRALEGSGRALLADRKPAKALKFLQPAALALPDRYTTHLALSRALNMAGQGTEARVALDRALKLNPEKAVVGRAAEAFQAQRLDEAEKILREHLAQSPDDPAGLRLLGLVAMEKSQWQAAMRLLKKSLAVAPDFLPAWADLATAQMKRDHFDEALASIAKAHELDPKLPHTWTLHGNILNKAQRHEEALVSFDKALELSPANAGALAGKGHALKTIGRQEESIEVYRECTRIHPAFGEAYWSLANFKTFDFNDEEVAVMEKMVVEAEMPDEPRVNFLYALGKQYENQGDYQRAFDSYRQGAELRRPHENYDPVMTQVLHDRIIEVFGSDFLAEREAWGDPDPAPILIVGLPRSGSTLIDQILASHSQVEGTQELPDLGRCVGQINLHGKRGVEYPEALSLMNEEDVSLLGRQYLKNTQRYRTGKAYFIDKMPNNFPNIGLLQLILPNATVINARRHPMDSCLGTWKQLFFNGQSFSYDFFELGQYYLQYQRMIDHWHAVLPGKVLDVRYEDVVSDLEGQTRRILAHCGLEFEDQCLRFYETERAINTASSEQVRQPIYTKAVNFWRNYEDQLEELIEQLEPLLRQLPPGDQPRALKT